MYFNLAVTKLGHTKYAIEEIILDRELIDLTENSTFNDLNII